MNPRPTSRLLGFVRDTSREDTGPYRAARGAHRTSPLVDGTAQPEEKLWSDTSKVKGRGRGEVLLRETLDRQAPGTGQPD